MKFDQAETVIESFTGAETRSVVSRLQRRGNEVMKALSYHRIQSTAVHIDRIFIYQVVVRFRHHKAKNDPIIVAAQQQNPAVHNHSFGPIFGTSLIGFRYASSVIRSCS